jgi:hypothetical protein
VRKSQARIFARDNGEKFYTPEKPCARGHNLRLVSTGCCIECKRLKEKERTAGNREAYNARKKRERFSKLHILAERARLARVKETPEAYALRLEKAKIKQRQWRVLNVGRQSVKDAKKAYKIANPGKVNAGTIKRRLSKLNRTPAWLTEDDHWIMKQAYELAALRKRIFGFDWHVDHIIPLQGGRVSGLHVPTNIQVIPWWENLSKANKHLPK